MKKATTLHIKKITNRILETPATLLEYSRLKLTAVNSKAPSQAGMWIRPGVLSEKTGKIGAPAIYCRFKTQSPRPRVIVKVADVITSKGDSGTMTLDQVEKTCARWREQGAPDSLAVVAPSTTDADPESEFTLSWCFDYWLEGDIKGKARSRAPGTLTEARRKWAAYTPTAWLERSILDIKSGEIMTHANKMKNGKWQSQTSGKKIKSRAVAREWLTMMSSVFSSTRVYHNSPFNLFLPALDYFPKGKGGHRALTEQEIKAVLTFRRQDCYKADRTENTHLWLRILALKFCLLSGFRRAALCDLKVSEINGVAIDREKADKTFNEHRLPIPTQMRAILDEALLIKKGIDPEVAGRDDWKAIVDCEFLFCTSDGRRYAIGNERELLKYALQAVINHHGLPMVKGKKQKVAKHMTAHCFRYTVETYAQALGVDPDPILNHAKRKSMGDVYNDPTDKMIAETFARVTADHQKITDHLFEIAAS